MGLFFNNHKVPLESWKEYKKKHEIIVFEMIDGEAIEIYGGNNLAD